MQKILDWKTISIVDPWRNGRETEKQEHRFWKLQITVGEAMKGAEAMQEGEKDFGLSQLKLCSALVSVISATGLVRDSGRKPCPSPRLLLSARKP